MSPGEFRSRLRTLCISIEAFARLTGCDVGTVRAWSDGEIPPWVPLLLSAWIVAGVPVDAWDDGGGRE